MIDHQMPQTAIQKMASQNWDNHSERVATVSLKMQILEAEVNAHYPRRNLL
jgi:hypothetical protein